MASQSLIKRIINLVTIVAATSLMALPAQAESPTTSATQGAEISPAVVELNAEKGKSYTLKLTVTNVTVSDLIYQTSVDDFNAKDETGTPQVLLNSNLPATASIKTWVTTGSTFSLKSHQSMTVVANVTIPSNAEPGGHYGVLRFSGRAPELQDSSVGQLASPGVLILIRVSGAITEQASVASFYAANSDKQSSFFEKSPITFVVRIKNEGNIHVKPVGGIEVRDMFGGLVNSLSINSDKSNVLPGSIRRFETTLNKDWMIGFYSATLTLGYGSNGQALTSTASFWVVPYKLILVALLVLVTLVFIFSKLIKAYNRRIIARSRNENHGKTKKH